MTNVVGILAVALTVALPAIVSALCQMLATKSAMDSMSRQPETSGDVRTTLLLALAFMEALTLFAFVVAILLWIKL